jgi:hypothetical protein
VQTRLEAKIWMIQNQLARRNLEPYQRAELVLRMKPLIAAKAKANQQRGGGTVRLKADNRWIPSSRWRSRPVSGGIPCTRPR